MQNDEPIRFELIGQDKKRITCEVLFTFDSDEWKGHYLVYCDADNPGMISCSRYVPEQLEKGNVSTLIPIETDEEWAFVDRVINQALGGVVEN